MNRPVLAIFVVLLVGLGAYFINGPNPVQSSPYQTTINKLKVLNTLPLDQSMLANASQEDRLNAAKRMLLESGVSKGAATKAILDGWKRPFLIYLTNEIPAESATNFPIMNGPARIWSSGTDGSNNWGGRSDFVLGPSHVPQYYRGLYFRDVGPTNEP